MNTQRLSLTGVASLMIVFGTALAGAPAAELAPQLTIEKSEHGVRVLVDGQLFTEYLTRSGAKPVLWPIIGPTGRPMTRAYPVGDAAGRTEKRDHIHHRSFWFTHGIVNGTSFWDENGKNGTIVHRQFQQAMLVDAGKDGGKAGAKAGAKDGAKGGGKQVLIVTTNDWLDRDGKKVCEDERTLRFGADADRRWIDFDVTVKATAGPLTFGDTKEGAFGVRVASSMDVDAKKGGRIINSEGQTDGATWGKQASWVDYSGPVDDQTVGIAILNHPTSFRYPTYWHVRTYGLFAANPWGLHDFKGSKDASGAHTTESGGSFTLRYRVLLHKGDEKQGRVAEAFAAYGRQK